MTSPRLLPPKPPGKVAVELKATIPDTSSKSPATEGAVADVGCSWGKVWPSVSPAGPDAMIGAVAGLPPMRTGGKLLVPSVVGVRGPVFIQQVVWVVAVQTALSVDTVVGPS